MKRRGFLKSLLLVGVTAAVSTELAFKSFRPDEKISGGLFNNNLEGNVSYYEHLTVDKIEEILQSCFSKPRNPQISMYLNRAGVEEFSKAMRNHDN